MGVQLVFSRILNPATTNLSARFTDAIAFYINAPLLSSEVEINVFLQIYLPGERVRNIPLGKIEEQTILLNLADTETVTAIASQFQDTELEMALLFLPSQAFTLQVYVITKEVTLLDLQDQLAVISQQLNDCVTPNDILDLVDTVSDIAFVVNLALPFFGLPSIPTPTIAPNFPFYRNYR